MTTVEHAPTTGADAALLAELADALRRVRQGDFKVRLSRRTGLAGEVVDGFNDVVDLQELRNRDLLRISRVVGREGRMTERLDEEHFEGAWVDGVHAVNTMVDQLSSFADEVTRVAREVGTEGKLGGQADVRGVSGTWRDLTDNVN